MGRPIYTLPQVGLQSSAHTGMQVANRKPILQDVGCASFLRVCWSLSEGLNVDVYLGRPRTRALMQQLRQAAPVHSDKSSYPTDIGTGIWSQEVVALPFWKVNTAFESIIAPGQRQSGEAGGRVAARGQTSACRLAVRRTSHLHTR